MCQQVRQQQIDASLSDRITHYDNGDDLENDENVENYDNADNHTQNNLFTTPKTSPRRGIPLMVNPRPLACGSDYSGLCCRTYDLYPDCP